MCWLIRKSIVFLCLSCLGIVFAHAQISGHVLDESGKGIADVVVSIGANMVQTDERGYYMLDNSTGGQFVQISVPKGYLVKREQTLPLFFHRITDESKKYDFHLTANKKGDAKHVFFVQTDVQAASEEDYDLYKKHIVSDMDRLRQQYGNTDLFGVDLGDIVGDNPSLYPYYLKMMSGLPMPFFRAIGNHDMAYWGRSHETSERHFHNHFGPTTYSFNKGNVHYVVLNNNFFIGREYFYMGYIDERTFQWLEKDLSYVPKGNRVFVMLHIPTSMETESKPFSYNYSNVGEQTVNSSALYNLLKDFDTHIFSGHTHVNHNVVRSSNLVEHNTAAASGAWWQAAICTDGTPRGYAVYEVDENNVEWYYKSAGHDRSHQLRVYYDRDANEVIANVWNYDSQWKVEWFQNGVRQGEMEQFEGIDPLAKELLSDKSKLKYDWISPSLTRHLFRIKEVSDVSKLEVRVTDRFGNEYREKIQ